MSLKIDNLKKLIIVGDRVLIRKICSSGKTKSGLLLPPGVAEKDEIQSGYIIKVGPGYPVPHPGEEEENWKKKEDPTKYIPLQAKEGDMAVFLQKYVWEIEFNREKFFIVPNSAILMLYRED